MQLFSLILQLFSLNKKFDICKFHIFYGILCMLSKKQQKKTKNRSGASEFSKRILPHRAKTLSTRRSLRSKPSPSSESAGGRKRGKSNFPPANCIRSECRTADCRPYRLREGRCGHTSCLFEFGPYGLRVCSIRAAQTSVTSRQVASKSLVYQGSATSSPGRSA